MPWLATGKKRSNARRDAKQEATTSTKETSTYTAEEEMEDDLLLTKAAFKRFRQEESDCDTEACTEEFEDQGLVA